MSGSIKAVFFDWAGTMVDFGSRAPLIAMQSVFSDLGIDVSEASVRAHMGKAKRAHVLSMLADPEINARWQATKGQRPTENDADGIMVELEPAMAREASKASALIPGALKVYEDLKESGIRIGSTTGYTQTMMVDVARHAREQGYHPETMLCAGDTSEGRPAPLMLWQAMIHLGVWPSRHCVAVDDAPVGIIAGREAGMWTIGVAGSGNELGLDVAAYAALAPAVLREKLLAASRSFCDAGADFVIATVADLQSALALIETAISAGQLPGSKPTQITPPVTAPTPFIS
jgi:phosphonoacetaldehyde hydrolase